MSSPLRKSRQDDWCQVGHVKMLRTPKKKQLQTGAWSSD